MKPGICQHNPTSSFTTSFFILHRSSCALVAHRIAYMTVWLRSVPFRAGLQLSWEILRSKGFPETKRQKASHARISIMRKKHKKKLKKWHVVTTYCPVASTSLKSMQCSTEGQALKASWETDKTPPPASNRKITTCLSFASPNLLTHWKIVCPLAHAFVLQYVKETSDDCKVLVGAFLYLRNRKKYSIYIIYIYIYKYIAMSWKSADLILLTNITPAVVLYCHRQI